jgi:hypothetical protein
LYALQKGGVLVKVQQYPVTIRIPTPWGFLLKNQDFGLSLFGPREEALMGFLASPTEPRKFFVSSGGSIISVRDYDFEGRWGAMADCDGHNLTDFDYPAKKPAGTFRILTTGGSRNSTAVPISPRFPDDEAQTPRELTYGKQLEFMLNTEEALRGGKTHFEVLNFTNRGASLSNFAYYELPEVVKKYDVDLVIGLGDWTGYEDYYACPMTSEGIPAVTSTQAYKQQRLSERASGIALDLIKRCRALKIPISEKQDYPGDGFWGIFLASRDDEQVQAEFREMTGKRLSLLNEKLGTMKTSSGNCPQLIIYYAPYIVFPNDYCESYWTKVCAQYHLKFLDLTEPFDALKLSYFPAEGSVHYTTCGNELVARLLSHYLVENKYIPF